MIAMVVLRREPPILWRNVVLSMQEAGYSLRDIAGALQMPHTTVQRWLGGSCPNYEDGRALLNLFELVRNCVPPTQIS